MNSLDKLVLKWIRGSDQFLKPDWYPVVCAS